MNLGITRWNEESLYPKPFTPVQSSLKLRAVSGSQEGAEKHMSNIRCEIGANVRTGDDVVIEFEGDTTCGCIANADIKLDRQSGYMHDMREDPMLDIQRRLP